MSCVVAQHPKNTGSKIDRPYALYFSFAFFESFFMFFFSTKNLIISHKKIGSLKKCKNFEFSVICIFAYFAVSNFLFHPDELVVVFSDLKKMNEKYPRKSSPKFISDKKTYTQTHCVEYAALSTQYYTECNARAEEFVVENLQISHTRKVHPEKTTAKKSRPMFF